jgi:hypothetical protein
VIVEKPFGRDSDSSRELGRGLAKHLNEDQIYRIDHYLGMKVTQAFCIGGGGVDGSRELRHGAAKHVDEDWIYRIDRILGNKVTQAFCLLGEGGVDGSRELGRGLAKQMYGDRIYWIGCYLGRGHPALGEQKYVGGRGHAARS